MFLARLFKKKAGKRYFHPRSVVRDMVFVASIVSVIFFDTFHWRFFAIGITVFLIGGVMHLWCKACLVRNQVVTTWGPYNIVRHPFYLANLFLDSGLCIATGNTYLLAGYFVLFPVAYLPEMIAEEKKLINIHGGQYQSYRDAVPGLLPYKIWRIFIKSPQECPYKSWAILRKEHELPRLLRILSLPLLFPIGYNIIEIQNDTLHISHKLVFLAIFVVLNVVSRIWMRQIKKRFHKAS
ncbi:isoprenylcysteine carboxylmethyltransferase family protein [Candidatus Peregrinibacteria bacterium]|nr:isoprenylcysteine carboxylmethyltransferase family protein [Candidatus Peregrinibacteria bacterium]